MLKDILYILPADFPDMNAAWYCRECAEVRGLLAYYPAVAEQLDVRTIDFPRPRADVVAKLGLENQNLPALVVADPDYAPPPQVTLRVANDVRFADGAAAIGEYLADRYGIGRPHP